MGCVCTRSTIYIDHNKYYILDVLGEGGFSTVYLVRHSKNKEYFAVKKILVHDPEEQSKAFKELEYHSMLKHKNILPCYQHSYFQDRARLGNENTYIMYLLLPYYSRGTLADDLQRKEKHLKRWDTMDVLFIFKQICEGVKVFHEHNPPLAHHDLKPANILLANDNRPVIMDLGSTSDAVFQINSNADAQKVQDFASEHCTMPYRAPELFSIESNSIIDQRTDIWSLGCVLFALCYYKSPFDIVHERGDSVALAAMSGLITIPDTRYPQELTDLILYMIKVNPAERPYIEQVLSKIENVSSKLNGERNY